METYRLRVDRKYTIWEREYYMIEAESETEALEKCLSPDVECSDSEFQYDTADHMTPKDNDNYPTLEVFNEDTDERIFSNNPVSNEDR